MRRNLYNAAKAVAVVAFVAAAGCCSFSGTTHNGPVSDHFDGDVFHNRNGAREMSLDELAEWRLTRDKSEWPDAIPGEPADAPPTRVKGDSLRVTFVNHATVLFQTNELNILADPVWSDYVGPVELGSQPRRRPPGILFEDLPPIDVVLISHNHYDHMDMPTLKRLWDAHQPLVVAPLGNHALLYEEGIQKAIELDWGDRIPLTEEVFLELTEAQHFSNRGMCDRNKTLWGGFVIDAPGGPIYFAGDTGFGEFFEDIAEENAPLRFAAIPIGAFRPREYMEGIHVDPDEALQAHVLLESRASMGIHYNTFSLADDALGEPEAEARAAMERYGVPSDEFLLLPNGGSVWVDPIDGAERTIAIGATIKGERKANARTP